MVLVQKSSVRRCTPLTSLFVAAKTGLVQNDLTVKGLLPSGFCVMLYGITIIVTWVVTFTIHQSIRIDELPT